MGSGDPRVPTTTGIPPRILDLSTSFSAGRPGPPHAMEAQQAAVDCQRGVQ